MIRGLNLTMLPSVARVNSSGQAVASARVTSASSASATASAKVIFGSQTQEISAVYSLSPAKISASAASQQNAQILGLMLSARGTASMSSLGSLGSALLSNLKDNPADFTQALSGVGMGDASGTNKSAVTLTIKTQSGSTVHLTMTQQEGGIAVEMKTDGEALNEKETAAIASLGTALQDTLSGLSEQTPNLDITKLTQFDSSVLKSVDLKTDLSNGGSSLQSLNFHADNSSRYVAYQDNDFSLKLSSDTSKPALSGSYAHQQATLKAYDDKFDKARRDGHGDRDQMAVLKSAFRALNSTASDKVSTTASPVSGNDIRIGDNGQSQLSGLNDFSLSLTQVAKSTNPAHEEEKDRFTYTASQSTEENTQSNGAKLVKQTVHSHLSASWHEALDSSIPLALNLMKASQNYYYHQLENDEENTTTLNFNARGQLARVGHHTAVDNHETVKKYVRGEMVDQTVTPEKYSRDNIMNLLSNV